MMKSNLFKALLSVMFAGRLFLPVAATAQPAASVSLGVYAGLSITGTTGSVYAVQSNTDLAQTNGWNTLEFVRLPVTNYLWVDTTTTATTSPKRFYRALLQSAPTNTVFISPNTFVLGSPTNEFERQTDEGPQMTVTISRGFWIGKFEVTQREYLAVTGINPSFFNNNLNLPVESVSWSDATNYCALRTQQEQAAGIIPPGSHYRLPTEAEWEYAARAGTSTRYSYGDDLNNSSVTNYAWIGSNSGPIPQTHPVGQKLPNPWGLYDMMGNVFEWCLDWYGPYPGGFAIDPKGAASNPQGNQVMRGSSYDYFEDECRSAGRMFQGHADTDLGLRVVLATGLP